jgi:hypothetical protein
VVEKARWRRTRAPALPKPMHIMLGVCFSLSGINIISLFIKYNQSVTSFALLSDLFSTHRQSVNFYQE